MPEPRWVTGRILAFLVRACRHEFGARLADLDAVVADRILALPRQRYAAGDRDRGTLGASLFVAIMEAEEAGDGRALLAVVASLVFWELNELRPSIGAGVVVNAVRRAAGREEALARIALLARERPWARPG